MSEKSSYGGSRGGKEAGMSERRYEFTDSEGDGFWVEEGAPFDLAETVVRSDCPSRHMEFGKFMAFAAHLASVADELQAELDMQRRYSQKMTEDYENEKAELVAARNKIEEFIDGECPP